MPRFWIIAFACVCTLFAGSIAWAGPRDSTSENTTLFNAAHRADFAKDNWSSSLNTSDDITSEVTWATGSMIQDVLSFHGSTSNFFLKQDVESTSLEQVALYSAQDSGMFDVDFPGLNFRLYGGASNEDLIGDSEMFTMEDTNPPGSRAYRTMQQVDNHTAVPEPISLVIFGSGLAVLGIVRSTTRRVGSPRLPLPYWR